ncbi:MAG: hypothetical protein H0X11_02330 [Betaproteobacteria bacterium]|nr:hypothetical protein [Betaproteobacteria bacterium]
MSAATLATPAVKKSMGRLRELLHAERLCKLQQGDVLVKLIDGHHLRAIDIARQTKQRPNDLSQMYLTCRMFPPRARRRTVPYNVYFMSMRMVRKFKHLRLQPMDVLAEICEQGFSQHRAVTAHFSAKARQVENDRAMRMAELTTPEQPFNRAYHAKFQTLRNIFPDESIKLLHVDPPYVYPSRGDGRYAGGSASSQSCDSAGAEESIGLVIDLLRDWQPKLKLGGVLLLWQAAGLPPRQIVDAIEQHRWSLERVVIWDKGRAQAGDFASPYAPQSEWLLVLKRPGNRLHNHDNSSRGDIIRFAPVSVPHLAGTQQHAFEKPVELGKYLVRKHTHERELVFDACGCTGSMSLAAIETNRQWVYAESNAANYALGTARLAGVPIGASAVAG